MRVSAILAGLMLTAGLVGCTEGPKQSPAPFTVDEAAQLERNQCSNLYGKEADAGRFMDCLERVRVHLVQTYGEAPVWYTPPTTTDLAPSAPALAARAGQAQKPVDPEMLAVCLSGKMRPDELTKPVAAEIIAGCLRGQQ